MRFGFLNVLVSLFVFMTQRPAFTQTNAAASPHQTYSVNGIIREIHRSTHEVVIQHETVTNYMPAMTMPFFVKNDRELKGLQTNEAVTFQMVIAGNDAWIEAIHPNTNQTAAALKAPPGLKILRDVDPLTIGDALPTYHFTNQLGQAVDTGQFLGQPFAFTFFFTRCPYPTFCPFLSANFADAEKRLLASPHAPKQWHLFSISFDASHDSPQVLKNYAARYEYDPAHWSFVTGDDVEITALADQVGETFSSDETGGIAHNLRTVVVDSHGRIQKIFTDNRWTAEQLVAELIAAGKK